MQASVFRYVSSTDNTGSDPPVEICPMCCETIVEATEDTEGQEALCCEGTCQKWLHCWCAGVDKDSYEAFTLSEEPLVYPLCRLSEHCQPIRTLVKTIEMLKKYNSSNNVSSSRQPMGKYVWEEAGLETEPTSSKAVTNDGASAE